jgi:hypothetical protein
MLNPQIASDYEILLMVTRILYGQEDEALARALDSVARTRRRNKLTFTRSWKNDGHRPTRRSARP